MDNKSIVMCPCENIKYVPINESLNSSQGSCLIVPVYIHNICENEHLLVIVEVYQNNNLYARQIKKIFTEDSDQNCWKCKDKNCCCDVNLIDDLFVGNFDFYFLAECNPKCICVKVKTQYIYNC